MLATELCCVKLPSLVSHAACEGHKDTPARKKAVKCFKQGVLGQPSRNMEDRNIESDMSSGDSDQEVLEGEVILLADLEVIFMVFWQRI